MNVEETTARPNAGEWTEIEARFRHAKQALLDTQERHCDAAHEFLLARAQVRQMLEAIFPGAEPEAGCGCNGVAAQRQHFRPGASYATPQSSRSTPRTQEEAL